MSLIRQLSVVSFVFMAGNFSYLIEAAEKKEKIDKSAAEKQMALTVETAGPDYAVMGEYVGTVVDKAGAGKPLAAQVMAQGDGNFNAVLLPGGLPGAGYTEGRGELTGVRTDGTTTFTGAGGKGTIIAEDFTGTDAQGQAFTLKKIVRVSSTLGAKPPAGAKILFDGTNTDAWDKGSMDEQGNLKVGALTKEKLTSFNLHIEFRLPFKPFGRDQDRCNSGVYVHQTYEFQVLDSFGWPIANNYAGSLYTVIPPLVNMVFPPLSWQTYDIDFTGPGFDADGKKNRNARATIRLNGVVVQDNIDIASGTGANKKSPELPEGGNLLLQDHGNPVVYRNIWVVAK
jgi:Domain of Unknown Function (DUF1080)